MMPKIYAAIEKAIAEGTPPQYVASTLVNQGWPATVVNEALNAWLSAHGRLQQKTGFKDWLKRYKRKALPATMFVVAISVVDSSIMLLRPWPTKIMVDSAFGNIKAPGLLAQYTHKPALILITSLMTIAIFLLGSVFGVLRDYFVLKLGFWLNRDIKEESFRHILHLPLYHQQRLAKGDYIYRQNILTNSLSDLVLDTSAQVAQSIIMIFGILAIMFWFNVNLTLISVVLIPFLFVLIRLFGPVLGKIARSLTQINSATSAAITEAIDNAETVQAFTLEEKQVGKANFLWWENYRLSRRGMFWSRGYTFTNSLLIILATSAAMYYGGTAALHGHMTLGQLLIFMTYMGYLLGPVETLATEIAARNQKKVDVSRVYEVLTDHEGVETLRQDKHFPFRKGRVEFQNVTYAYNNTVVLNQINLIVEPNRKIGIIGPSGAGKSTLLKLIPLFIEPTRGRILIDGFDIQTVSLQELRRCITWISQAPQLFNETIAENLQDSDVSRELTAPDVEKVITAADVTEFVAPLPLGLRSPVGEGGNTLSGGQKQRLAIARGLLKNAPVICMDEPTAALDSKSENYILNSIGPLLEGKTVLMVTHRKALLNLMDTIYVLEEGQLRDVHAYGGLDAYLQKISDLEAASPNKVDEAEAAAQEQMRQLQLRRLAELEEENAELQAANSLNKDNRPSDSEGTIYIPH